MGSLKTYFFVWIINQTIIYLFIAFLKTIACRWLQIKRKAQISIEFIFGILILLIIVYFFITMNVSFKNKLKTNINYKNYNQELCLIKQQVLTSQQGVIINDSCKEIKSTSNNPWLIDLDVNCFFNNNNWDKYN